MNTPEAQAERATATALATIQAERTELDGWTIDTADDADFAAEILRDVKARHKALEVERKKITGPLNTATRAVNALFKPPRELLEDVERMIKGKIASYLEAREAANAAAIEAASTADTPEQASEALATVEQAEAPAGVSVRHKYRAVVFNPEIVPDQFCMPDEAAIQSFTDTAVRMNGEPTPIPGVRFEREAVVASRAKVSK